MVHPVLINGVWVASKGTKTFQAVNPATEQPIPGDFPVSPWAELDAAIAAASEATRETRGWPGSRFADFLECYAAEIEKIAEQLVETAHLETALPKSPRLKDAELPRTINQLRQAATAARSDSWRDPIIDRAAGIRSMLGPIGPVIVFGPNNFPFAFNGVSGGDFAAAIAAGNPVIAKGHACHPETTRLFAEAALISIRETGMPRALVQLVYRTSHEDGFRLVSDHRIGAIGYTGARHTGLKLKAAADACGKPIYLELSSINPVFVLQGAIVEKGDALANDFTTSCLMGTGQFCTNPGIVVIPKSPEGDTFLNSVADRFKAANVGTMLGQSVRDSFAAGIGVLTGAGAEVVTGGKPGGGKGFCFQNTLLKISAESFVKQPETFQTEAFGNGSLFIVADSPEQMVAVAEALEGNLTGCIYSDSTGKDDSAYDIIAPALRCRVGRLLNDKMPTGVAVSAAMNHGGPFPATGHPGFTAVGIPTSIRRFAMLQSFDNVRAHRLPSILQDKNPNGQVWRRIDGEWTKADVS
ncbi:MAG: aldehyde dehydrogenase (NADP(+)) [Planctomyces sp.]|nr:aldehyde dehydrogenase (NADP(+)) [Planctomyces sp.]